MPISTARSRASRRCRFIPSRRTCRIGKPATRRGKADKGKGLIGAINYLASKGVNSISFLPYNAGGDGDNVWPFVARDDKFHYDVSKLDQWQVVFDHAQQKGIYLHFKLQENEIDDNVRGNPAARRRCASPVRSRWTAATSGRSASYTCASSWRGSGMCSALNWNIGEENTQSSEQQLAMAMNLRDTDPYGGHHIVVHTFPNGQESVYPALLGSLSPFTGASLQMAWNAVHERTLRWVLASSQAKKPWVVANDEQGPAGLGVPPDPGYSGFAGKDAKGLDVGYTLHDIRKYTLWGNLMAGGAGVDYYFGYGLPDNDLVAENFRSRDKSWDYGRIAIDFFHSQKIPFWEMTNADGLVGNEKHDNSRYCFAKANDVYLVYLPSGGTTTLDLSKASWPVHGGVVRSTQRRRIEERQRADRQRRCGGAPWDAAGQSRARTGWPSFAGPLTHDRLAHTLMDRRLWASTSALDVQMGNRRDLRRAQRLLDRLLISDNDNREMIEVDIFLCHAHARRLT